MEVTVTRDDVYGVLYSWGYPKDAVKYWMEEAHELDRSYYGWDDRYKRAEAEAIRVANIAAKKKQIDLAAQQLATQQQDLATQQKDLATQQQAAQQRERLSNEERIRALMRAQSRGAIAGE